MNKAIVSGLLAVLALAGRAETVDREQAETAARAWVRDGHAVGESLSPEVADVREVRFSDDGLPLYVADFAGGGFAVLASDTLCEPVVFYSGSGAFPSDPEHPIRALLAAEGRRLAQTVAAGGEPRPLWARLLAPSRPRLMAAASATLSDSEVRVAPLLKTHWSQVAFNDYTPGEKDGDPARGYFQLGCGPTALAQVMYTLRWPQDAVAPFTCTQSSISWADGTSECPQFTAFGGTYDWDGMLMTPEEIAGDAAERDRMARFGFDVATAFATQWRERGHGTALTAGAVELWHGPMALTNFFHYSNAQFLSNTNSPGGSALPTDLVIRAMKSNLDARIPVVLEIHGTPGGHEVVGDGYGYRDGTFYGHFNFGWGGGGDGWYVIPNVGDFSSISGVMYNVFTNQAAGASIASGRVFRRSAPLGGATVSAYDGERLVGTATTDANGIYALVIPPGDYDIVAGKLDMEGTAHVTLGRCSGYSSKAWNSSGYYSGAVLPPEGISCGNVCDVDIDMVAPDPAMPIAIPTGTPGLVYTGAAQVGVPDGMSYSVEGGSATAAGDYVATATLSSGYAWSDGTTGPKRVPWSIAKATLLATALDAECEAGDPVPKLEVEVTGFVNGETAATAAGYIAPFVATTYTPASPVGEYPITVAGGVARNYAFAHRDATLTATEPWSGWGNVLTEKLLYHIIAHPERHLNETYKLDPAPTKKGTPTVLTKIRVGFLEFGDLATVSTDGEGRLKIALSTNEDYMGWGHVTVVDDVPGGAQIIVTGKYPGALWFADGVTVHGGVNRKTYITTSSTCIGAADTEKPGSGTLYLDGSGKGIEFASIDDKTGVYANYTRGTVGTFVLSGNVTLTVKGKLSGSYDVKIGGERPATDANGNAWYPSDAVQHVFVSEAAADPWNPPAADATADEVRAALEANGFTGAAAANITTPAEFAAFRYYVCAAKGSEATVPSDLTAAEKANAYLAYALGAESIPATEITADDVLIMSYDDASGFLEVRIEGLAPGAPMDSNAIRQVLSAAGGADLRALSEENVNVAGQCVEAGRIRASVTPKTADPPAFFIRAELKR